MAFAAALALSGCADKAKPDYARCVQLEAKGDVGGSWDACNAAVGADVTSESGKAAAAMLAAMKPKYDAWKQAQERLRQEAAAQELARAKEAEAARLKSQEAREAWLRQRVRRSGFNSLDGQCAGKSLPPFAYTYQGGSTYENTAVASSDGCRALYPNDNPQIFFCCSN